MQARSAEILTAQPWGRSPECGVGLCAVAAYTLLRLVFSDTCACQTTLAVSSCILTSSKSLWNKAWKFDNGDQNGTPAVLCFSLND